MSKITELHGHNNRVLHTCLSPDGTTVCSAGDETLRFWRVFETPFEMQKTEKKDFMWLQNNNFSIR